MPTQSFTSGNDSFTVHTAGTYDLDFLGGDDTLTVDGGDSTTAHMGIGNDHVRLLSGLASVFGDAGADKFDIWASSVIVDGGADNDTVNIRGGADQTAHGGLGADRFNFQADGAGVSLFGEDGNDTFFGYHHQVSGTISGGLGNDLFVDFVAGTTLAGNSGNDIYRATAGNVATFLENPGEGIDSVQVARGDSFTLPANIENISVQGFSGSTTGSATLNGNALNNAIIGHNNAETIDGLGGNDRISAQGGNDTVHGGDGNDVLVGGTGSDSLFGDSGNDSLRGVGVAVMAGALGDDVYYVDGEINGGDDTVTENSGEGTDTVRVFVNYALTDNVENGIIQNTGFGLVLFGNVLDNNLTGNHGDDSLHGLDGNDTLRGGAGDDFLNGGNGTDTMIGGTGNDEYMVEQPTDVAIENPGEGIDTIDVGFDYTLPDNIENGQVSQSLGCSLTGNSLDNALTGREGTDVLNGAAGSDTLTGADGNDTFLFIGAGDSAPGAADQITDFHGATGASDVIDLSAIDANTAAGGDQAFASVVLNTPTANSIWYTFTDNGDGTADWVFKGDINGDTTADFEFHVHSVGSIFNDDIVL